MDDPKVLQDAGCQMANEVNHGKPKATKHPHLAFAAFGHAPSNEMMYDVK